MMRRSVTLTLSALVVLFASKAGAQDAHAVSVPRGYVRLSLPVATRDLARGDTVGAADFTLRDTTMVWRWNGVSPDTTRAITGWVTRRAIVAGEVLRAPAVMAPPLVTSGATVTVVYQDGPVRLTLTGVAMNTAPLGAAVGVRIDRTRRLDGIAVAPNTVRLR
ncbi:MAG: flagellar basal body P-ring formation chaperone FlgA [Gemmatimonadota bacterium]